MDSYVNTLYCDKIVRSEVHTIKSLRSGDLTLRVLLSLV